MAAQLFRRLHIALWSVTTWSLLFGTALVGRVNTAAAESFRIETKVYSGDEKKKEPKPVSEATTLFLDGVVYDFLKKPEQTAVFRKRSANEAGEFTLLDDQHSIYTKISTDKVAGAMKKLQAWASRQRDPFLKFAAHPDFEESYDSGTGKVVLASHLETYTVTTLPSEHPDAMAEYKEFLDWYTQLNTLLSAGNLPPEPRLRLNSVLARRKVVPIKVELSRAGEDPLRAEHEFTWRLSQDDHKRIDGVREALSTYQEVDSQKFLIATRPKVTPK